MPPADRRTVRTALILAGAGESKRMTGIDKILAPLGGFPLIYWPLLAAERCDLVDRVIVLLSPANIEAGRALIKDHGFAKVSHISPGGIRRQDSVKIGVGLASGCDWVVVHDAARPFLDRSLIAGGLTAAAETGASLAAVKVKDTIKIAAADMTVAATPLRERMWSAQTPQVFRFDIIARAYEQDSDATDDSSLIERTGNKVKMYQGSYENIKITTAEDLALAEIILTRRQCE
ncbi:MAG: 2-C-methyl-D-erythritol 4-phosphate cytidylyltransferase [Chloroflexi bacterium]|nr:2-C-methyl-D-erythritol 4-phosphate cytidylyltransferase [Chloroflexota bacterium]